MEARVYGQSLGRRLSICLGKYATAFQAEIHAILAWMLDQRNMLLYAVIDRQL
jgi:hypothetical protein